MNPEPSILLCFFEDDCLENFHPLTLTRPVYDLRVGILTLGEKWIHALQDTPPGNGDPVQKVAGPLRNHLKGVFEEMTTPEYEDRILWLNPRFIPTSSLTESVKKLKTDEGLVANRQLIAALVSPANHQQWMESGIDLTDIDYNDLHRPELLEIQNVWELFQLNGKQIVQDIALLNKKPVENTADYPNAILVNPERIFIEDGAVIEAGAMLIAGEGPVYIGKNAQIMASAIVRGPSAVCEKSVIKMGAKIYEDTTIGPVCKVGGEISNTIFHSYSNKAHDGYAGNSVFGQWCNLGADTNTSNLKNNYSTVKVVEWKTNKEIDTGQQFIGTIMGDHSKTGINAMLNTGTLCGVCCNLFSDDYPPKFIPSFSWVSGQNIVPYHFDKAAEAMERMMARRSVELTPSYRNMMKAIFDSTSF